MPRSPQRFLSEGNSPPSKHAPQLCSVVPPPLLQAQPPMPAPNGAVVLEGKEAELLHEGEGSGVGGGGGLSGEVRNAVVCEEGPLATPRTLTTFLLTAFLAPHSSTALCRLASSVHSLHWRKREPA